MSLTETTSFFCDLSQANPTPSDLSTRDSQIERDFVIGASLNGRYVLKSLLGSGGMGMVFLAQDTRLNRHVAIKVIHRLENSTDRLEQLLEREAKLGAGINHPNIATVLDFGTHGSRVYSVSEYIEGETLRAILRRRKTMPLDEVCYMISKLAQALDFVHIKGIVHRDLKPENICLAADGTFKILDLGIAHNMFVDAIPKAYFGTPAYSSPEQVDCNLVDGKSDQYALALIAFECLTGTRAFSGTEQIQLFAKHLFDPPPVPSALMPSLPVSVDRAIGKALEKLPSKRFLSCREFAQALQSEATGRVEQRHLMSVDLQDRIGYYMCHASEHSLIVRQLSQRMERAGYRCWYYERDAKPNIAFHRQSLAALGRSSLAVIFLTKESARSLELFSEIENAYKIGVTIAPIFIDCQAKDLESMRQGLQVLLGASQPLDMSLPFDFDRAEKYLRGIASDVGVKPAAGAGSDAVSKPRIQQYVWATDANQLEISDLPHIVFRNELVDDFLLMKNKFFLAATKGLGKTLLLTFKRHLITEGATDQNLTLIPEGRPYLDMMDELRQLPRHLITLLSDLSSSKRIWSAALRISAISYQSDVIEDHDILDVALFPASIQRWLRGHNVEPTVAFKELLKLSVSDLNRLLDNTENFLSKKMRMIHSGMCIFIDKVDQAVRGLTPQSWIHVQAGLLEAAWDMMGSNRHIRIFATIRQEAFSTYQSDIKNNLHGATINLQYTEDELGNMMDQLARCYEGCTNFNDFIGFNVVRHRHRPNPEDCFHFVRRHTFGRPRDLVIIASDISARRSTMDEGRLSRIVHELSSSSLINNIFAEVQVLLDCLGDEESRMRLFDLLPTSILSRAEAVQICESYNGLAPGALDQLGVNAPDIYHPFRDLFVAGLLGVIEIDPEKGMSYQRFRQPNDYLSISAHSLPMSTYYLLHPAINRFIGIHRPESHFQPFQHLAVGHGLRWHETNPYVMQIERGLFRLENGNQKEIVHRLLTDTQAILDGGDLPRLRYEIETSQEWHSLLKTRRQQELDEVLLAFEALFESTET